MKLDRERMLLASMMKITTENINYKGESQSTKTTKLRSIGMQWQLWTYCRNCATWIQLVDRQVDSRWSFDHFSCFDFHRPMTGVLGYVMRWNFSYELFRACGKLYPAHTVQVDLNWVWLDWVLSGRVWECVKWWEKLHLHISTTSDALATNIFLMKNSLDDNFLIENDFAWSFFFSFCVLWKLFSRIIATLRCLNGLKTCLAASSRMKKVFVFFLLLWKFHSEN